MAKKSGNFKRGDIIWLDFTSTKGHEQSGRRPALVLSSEEYNEKTGLLLACPITSKTKGYPFEVPITGRINGVVLVDQIRSIDWRARNADHAGTASLSVIIKTRNLLKLLLP